MFLMMLAIVTSLGCSVFPGADELWIKPRTIFVGELHGTREAPKAFTDLVCAEMRTGKPLTVALEMDAAVQPDLDRYLSSDGGLDARGRFLQTGFWTTPAQFADGRSSQAYFDMIEALRVFHTATPSLRVVAFVGPHSHGHDINVVANEAMAAKLEADHREFPHNIVLVYTGAVHAARGEITTFGPPFKPAAALIERADTLSLVVRGDGGSAWNCAPDCAVHRADGYASKAPRGIELKSLGLPRLGIQEHAYDGVISIGQSFSPSLPVSAVKPPS